MLFDNRTPRYLPHLGQDELLAMGLSPLAGAGWIETDSDWLRYHKHKLGQRLALGPQVFRAQPQSLPAQQELAQLLLRHLTQDQRDLYRLQHGTLVYLPEDTHMAINSAEPLWHSSLWVADDLLIMQQRDERYHLSAASLCSPSAWLLDDKFGRPIAEIHDPVPGFSDTLTPSVERFFAHLKVEHPVVRYNWSLQAGDGLDRRPGQAAAIDADTPLFYRTERQSLRRLPRTGAIAFTIRVYLHPLEMLPAQALASLLRAVSNTAPALARYKGFDRLAPAMARYSEATGAATLSGA